MSRKFDIIVFGASGVSGQCIVEELALRSDLKFGIAGENEEKLKEVLGEISRITDKSLDDVEVIVADVTSESSLRSMCAQTKILLNYVGPYCLYGEQVVKACLDVGTNYVDVCGEPQFLETMQLKYYDEAQQKDLYVIGACGFDSIPCDMGVEYLKQCFLEDENVSGHANGVEMFVEFHFAKDSKANFATWQSAIHSCARASELKSLRKHLQSHVFPTGHPTNPFPIETRPMLFKSEVTNKWCVYYMGSDQSVATRSQMYAYEYNGEKPVQIHTYMCLPSFVTAILYLFLGAIFISFAKFRFGRYLLEKFPEFFSFGLFTNKPVKSEQLTQSSFTMTLLGCGWSKGINENEIPDKEVKVTVRGPDPGCVTTAICAVAACSTLLDEEEKEKMPKGGGVLTPGAAFSKTNLIEKLMEHGVIMNVERKKSHEE